jgi:hypothetical protein
MSNCIPCPPCQGDEPLVCEPYGTVTTGNRIMVEDDAFCTKTLANPSVPANLIWDNGIKWKTPGTGPFDEFTDYTATGTTEARNLVTRSSDYINVLDFGADQSGNTDSSPAFQAAVNACGTSGIIYIPKGTYRLVTNVTTGTKAVSFEIDPNTSFFGGGQIQNPALYGYFYNGNIQDTPTSRIVGTSSSPVNNAAGSGVFTKHSSLGSSGTGQNPALFAVGYKYSTAVTSRVQGIYAEAIDKAGAFGTFFPLSRFAGIVDSGYNNRGDAYGIIAYAQAGTSVADTPNGSYCVAAEAEIQWWHQTPRPSPRALNPNNFSSAFVATNRTIGSTEGDAAFMVNPFTDVGWKGGFIVTDSVGAAQVSDVAFGCYQQNVVYGLDLAEGSYSFAAISIPNNSAIRAYNAAGTLENNILAFNGVDVLSLGIDVNVVHVQTKNLLPSAGNTWILGSNPAPWQNIYSNNPLTVVSDARLKKDIADCELGLDFIKELRPVSYKFIEGSKKAVKFENGEVTETESIPGVRRHYGLLAQEVRGVLSKFNLTGEDFSGWNLSDKDDPNSAQSLRYEAFISPMIKAIKEIADKIEEIESKLN